MTKNPRFVLPRVKPAGPRQATVSALKELSKINSIKDLKQSPHYSSGSGKGSS